MDFWKLMDVLHRKQLIMNAMRSTKLDRFCKVLDLRPGSSVLDVGCGKGEFLVRLNELYSISGVGVDKSPYCVRDCEDNKKQRVPDADLSFLLMDAADYKSDKQFDVTCCMGASWIYGGLQGTLETLDKMTKPGGLIIAGEPHWKVDPPAEYLKAEGMQADSYRSHIENVMMGDQFGLTCGYTMMSDLEDWDHYEALHWWAAAEYVDENPDDPDNSEIIENMKKYRETYLKWGRDVMGWGLYIYRKPF